MAGQPITVCGDKWQPVKVISCTCPITVAVPDEVLPIRKLTRVIWVMKNLMMYLMVLTT